MTDDLIELLIEHGLPVVSDEDAPGVLRPIQQFETRRLINLKRLKERELSDTNHPELSRLAEDLPRLAEEGPEALDPETAIAIAETGLFDVCAWYQPIHFFGRDWGIFIREDCVVRLARLATTFLPASAIQGPYPLALATELVVGSTFCYFLHEHFHHKVESFGIRLWVVEGSDRYVRYEKGVYRPTLFTDDNLEEALANADSRQRLGDSPYRNLTAPVRSALRDALDHVFAKSPGGTGGPPTITALHSSPASGGYRPRFRKGP